MYASASTLNAIPCTVGGATTLEHSASVLFIIFIAVSTFPSSNAVRAFSTLRITSAGTCFVRRARVPLGSVLARLPVASRASFAVRRFASARARVARRRRRLSFASSSRDRPFASRPRGDGATFSSRVAALEPWGVATTSSSASRRSRRVAARSHLARVHATEITRRHLARASARRRGRRARACAGRAMGRQA